MSNEVEIVVRSKNRVKEGLDEARRDTAEFADEQEHVIGDSGDKAGKSFGAKLAGRFKGLPLMANPYGAAIGAALGAAMLPALGAAITGGALLSVGGGAIALGIKSAANDPKVQSAWADFAKKGKGIFADFGKPFVGPVLDSIKIFSGVLDDLRPGILRIGQAASKVVEPMARGFGELARNAMPGIEKAVKASVPLFEAIARHLPNIGKGISQFFGSIASGGPGATKLFDGLLTIIEKVIPATGKAIGALSRSFATLSGNDKVISFFRFLGDTISWLRRTITNLISGPLRTIRSEFAKVTHSVQSNREELSTLRRWLARVADFIADRVAPVLGRLLSNNIRASATAIRVLIGVISAMVRAAQSMASGVRGAASRVSSAFNAIRDAARRLRNAVRSALSGIFDPLVSGASRAYGSVVGKLQGIANFASRVTDMIPGFASGGISSGGLAQVGERGRELVRLPTGSTVMPNANTETAAMRNGGAQTVTVEVVSGGGRLNDLLVELLRDSIRVRGGNVQSVLGGA